MLMIRLQRTGRENLPTYRLVVAEKHKPVKGKFLEILGHYLPARDPRIFEFNKERIEHWVKQGACPTDTVARLLSKEGMKGLEKFVHKYTKQRVKKEQPPEQAAPPKAAAPEAPKEEAAPAEAQKKDEPAAEGGDNAEKKE